MYPVLVIHVKDFLKYPGAVYIGRPITKYPYTQKGSVLANPFRLYEESERDAVCRKYQLWLRQQWLLNGAVRKELLRLAAIENLTLACWCAPKPCHGDILAAAICALRQKG